MNKTKNYEIEEKNAIDSSLLKPLPDKELARVLEEQVHVRGKNIICTTDYRAHKRSPLDIIVDATEGFIPLWAQNQVLTWRFNAISLSFFPNPKAVRTLIKDLLSEAIKAWGDAVPIRFTEKADNSDFEIVVENRERCNAMGCVLASAFFPDAGRHQLVIYPTMFEQSREEQVETLAHEIGHIFGLRHYFALTDETAWRAIGFGEQNPFSIMNYGENSRMSESDRRDLKALYTGVWSGQLTQIDGTPIRLFRPFHTLNP